MESNIAGQTPPSQNAEPIPITCSRISDLFWQCSSAGNQVSNLRKKGDLQNCFQIFTDLKTCLVVKFEKDEAKRRVRTIPIILPIQYPIYLFTIQEVLSEIASRLEKKNTNDVFEFKDRACWPK